MTISEKDKHIEALDNLKVDLELKKKLLERKVVEVHISICFDVFR